MNYRTFDELTEARRHGVPGTRCEALRRVAPAVRDAITAEGECLAYHTCELATGPYPTKFAFGGQASSPLPFVFLRNQMQIVQFEDFDGVRRTLLFQPLDYMQVEKAPYYAHLKARFGDFVSYKLMAKFHGTVESWLEHYGLTPEDIDYLSYDHLHVTDLRKWLAGERPFFPRAKLLVQKAEWDLVHDLHPLQRPWFVPGGAEGIPEDRVLTFEGDAFLGKGVALIHTPGHTVGNTSLVAVTGEGVYVTSENGVGPESYVPEHSRIGGVAKAARTFGYEVVLNSNSVELILDQYASMLLEKGIASPSPHDPTYPAFMPSFVFTAHWSAPGLAPTFEPPQVRWGRIEPTRQAA